MDRALLALLTGLGCGLVYGLYIARKSARQQPIYGRAGAKFFHYLASVGMGGILPVVLASLLLGQGFRTAFPLALAFLLVVWVSLMIYAVLERPALKEKQATDQGWTREDARKSY
jgi:hypothetical protein